VSEWLGALGLVKLGALRAGESGLIEPNEGTISHTLLSSRSGSGNLKEKGLEKVELSARDNGVSVDLWERVNIVSSC
jgi:hypothetical protein